MVVDDNIRWTPSSACVALRTLALDHIAARSTSAPRSTPNWKSGFYFRPVGTRARLPYDAVSEAPTTVRSFTSPLPARIVSRESDNSPRVLLIVCACSTILCACYKPSLRILRRKMALQVRLLVPQRLNAGLYKVQTLRQRVVVLEGLKRHVPSARVLRREVAQVLDHRALVLERPQRLRDHRATMLPARALVRLDEVLQ